MGIFLSFLPWIAFMALAHGLGVRWIALACSALAAAVAARGGFKLLDFKSALFFLALFAASFVLPDPLLTHWAAVLGAAAIFLIVLTTILVGRPFTTPYAKEMTPPEVWETPAFKRANRVISTAWLAGFGLALAAAILTTLTPIGAPWLQIAAQVVAVAGPLLFQNRYRRRLAAQQNREEPSS